MLFSSLDLAPALQQALDACGYQQMTAIQQQAIIPARRGKDILANAQTGTGKTAAFAIPIIQQLIDRPKATLTSKPRALILTPTRELAEQLTTTIKGYTQFLPMTVTAIYGGIKSSSQEKKLRAGTDILIATPGRLLEHLVQGSVSLSDVEFVALDEADRMLDMGFISDVTEILQKTAKNHQTLLFSATLSQSVKELAHKTLKNHQVISVAKPNATADTVEHVVYPVEERRKADLLIKLIDENQWFQVLVFTSTKAQADTVMAALSIVKVKAALCHGDKSQGTRRRAIADFKSGKIQVLVATEVAARGIDIIGLDHVINYNLPYLAEDYVHRIGRTGRAGNPGQAISFVSREEERSLSNIERLISNKIKRITIPGFEVNQREALVEKVTASPRKQRHNKVSQTVITKQKIDKVKAKKK